MGRLDLSKAENNEKLKVRWCEEGVLWVWCGERHKHWSVAEPCRMKREQ